MAALGTFLIFRRKPSNNLVVARPITFGLIILKNVPAIAARKVMTSLIR